MAELVDALVSGTSLMKVGVRVPSWALNSVRIVDALAKLIGKQDGSWKPMGK